MGDVGAEHLLDALDAGERVFDDVVQLMRDPERFTEVSWDGEGMSASRGNYIGLEEAPEDQFGKANTTFSSDTPRIYARWRGQRLRNGAKVRAVWIAENIDIGEEVPPDYKVDEASAVAESPTAHGAFALSRPEDGWAIGDYRAEFYVDDVLVETVKIKIVK